MVEDEAFDLLTLAAFGHHSGQAVPASPTTGFARFLRFMSTFDFEHDAVIVDPQGMQSSIEPALRTSTRIPCCRELDTADYRGCAAARA